MPGHDEWRVCASCLSPFVPAKAGTQSQRRWIPAFAGMNGNCCERCTRALSQFCIARARNFSFSFLSKSSSYTPKFSRTALLKHLNRENSRAQRQCRAPCGQRHGDEQIADAARELVATVASQ